jgi:lambda family phage tail tape measure protein
MAGQIIAKMITMAILNKVVGLLPGSGSAPSFGSGVGLGLPLFGDYSGLSGTPFAKGGVFAENKIVPYAKGGIVKKPTMFAYANGGAGNFGLMGEAGPEAILPLSRGPSGKLGVQASGMTIGDINVNVDASGSSVEGDAEKSNRLGRAIGFAVQQELVKQKRPGGLLHSSV